jgi:hypothetical protein
MSVRNKCTHPGSIPDTSAFCLSTIFAEEPIIRETMRGRTRLIIAGHGGQVHGGHANLLLHLVWPERCPVLW